MTLQGFGAQYVIFNVLHWHEMQFKNNKHFLSEQEDKVKKKVKEKCFRLQIIRFVFKTLHTCISSWKEPIQWVIQIESAQSKINSSSAMQGVVENFIKESYSCIGLNMKMKC